MPNQEKQQGLPEKLLFIKTRYPCDTNKKKAPYNTLIAGVLTLPFN